MSKRLRYSLLTLLLLGALACRSTPAQPADAPNTPYAPAPPRSTIPAGAPPDAIKDITPEQMQSLQQMAQNQEAMFMGIKGTYAAQVPGDDQSYHVEENAPFIGQFSLWHSYPEAQEFILICLLDHVQTPCAPGDPLRHRVTLQSGEKILLPLETPALRRGLHDFSVTYWQNPYAAHTDPFADERVLGFFTYRDRITLFVGNDATPPSIATERLNGHRSYRELDYLYANPQENPFGEYGGIIMETHLQAAPNELVNLYVHLNNRRNIDMDMGITAFVDYQQIPLYRNGAWHTPLYVAVPTHTWQPIAVQFQAPNEPGLYEFVVVGALFPYARMDAPPEADELLDVVIMRAHSSARILLEVE